MANSGQVNINTLFAETVRVNVCVAISQRTPTITVGDITAAFFFPQLIYKQLTALSRFLVFFFFFNQT